MEKKRREKEEGKRKKRKKKEGKKKRREKKSWYGILVWKFGTCMELFGDFLCDVWNSSIGTTINLSLSNLCRQNPIRSVVGWYKMSFMVYFEF